VGVAPGDHCAGGVEGGSGAAGAGVTCRASSFGVRPSRSLSPTIVVDRAPARLSWQGQSVSRGNLHLVFSDVVAPCPIRPPSTPCSECSASTHAAAAAAYARYLCSSDAPSGTVEIVKAPLAPNQTLSSPGGAMNDLRGWPFPIAGALPTSIGPYPWVRFYLPIARNSVRRSECGRSRTRWILGPSLAARFDKDLLREVRAVTADQSRCSSCRRKCQPARSSLLRAFLIQAPSRRSTARSRRTSVRSANFASLLRNGRRHMAL